MNDIKIFKIGGNVIDNPEALRQFIEDFSTVDKPKILVHGGGKEATRLSERLGLKATMIEGRRVTDRQTLDIVTMVYAGLINKRIVSLMQTFGVKAIGLTGADADVIKATKRNSVPIDYGYVGDIRSQDIDTSFIALLLEHNIVPVFCAIMHDSKGNLLNCNADSVASSIAEACADRLGETNLIYCFEKDGVLVDIDDPESLIPEITTESFEELKQKGIISAGMIPKIDNAVKAIKRGVHSVTIKNSANISNQRGTVICAS